MTEIKVKTEDRSFRFRENTDIGTYYQVFSMDELEMMVRFAGFGSLTCLWEEAKTVQADREMSEQKNALQREYVRSKLFTAVSMLTGVRTRRV